MDVLRLCINLCKYVAMSEMHSEEKGVVPVFDLADRMNKALREGQVSVAEMAEYLGVHRNTLSRYLSGVGLTRRVRNLTMGGSYHTREFLRTTPKPDTLEQAWLRVGRAMTQAMRTHEIQQRR